MCGRTASTRAPGEIAQACKYSNSNNTTITPQWKSFGKSKYKPSFNKGPKSTSAILLKNCNFSSVNVSDIDERILLPMQWGLVPSWHKRDPTKFTFNMINCRLESLTEKKSFKKALENGQRCVVLADGFYEWETVNDIKQPYYIKFKEGVTPHPDSAGDEQMLTMAGIFDIHTTEEGDKLYTYSIITVDASTTFKALHHRMPAILQTSEMIEQWLEVGKVSWKTALSLLSPTDCLEWYPVSFIVNNVCNDTSDCLKKIDIEKEASSKNKSRKLMASWLNKSPVKGRSKAALDNPATLLQPPAKKQKK